LSNAASSPLLQSISNWASSLDKRASTYPPVCLRSAWTWNALIVLQFCPHAASSKRIREGGGIFFPITAYRESATKVKNIVGGALTIGSVFRIHAYTLGYTRDIKEVAGITIGLRGNVTEYGVSTAIKPFYGSHPVGLMMYLRLRLKGDDHMHHHHGP
jgi:hypothetical protein